MSTPSPQEIQAQALVASLEDALQPVRQAVRVAIAAEADPRLADSAVLRALLSRELFELCGGVEPEPGDSADVVFQNELASERVETILAFIDLAKEHSLPRKLLPRGDRVGDWLPPGTPVTVFGIHPAVVAPEEDRVRVTMIGYPHPVSFPRTAIAKEGEEWTPPKHTSD